MSPSTNHPPPPHPHLPPSDEGVELLLKHMGANQQKEIKGKNVALT